MNKTIQCKPLSRFVLDLAFFTMLMWLKATNRKPQIAKDRLVANSIAALTPSPELWGALLSNLKKMLERGEINQVEFDFISNSYETRTLLMSETEGDVSAITAGTVQDIRDQVMAHLVKDRDDKISKKDQEINDLRSQINGLEQSLDSVKKAIENNVMKTKRITHRISWRMFQIFVSAPFIYLLYNEFVKYFDAGKESNFLNLISISAVNILSALALFFIAPWRKWLRNFTDNVTDKFVKVIDFNEI